MNISGDTVNVLKNFSNINQNILVKPGNTIQTISTAKNILAEAEITEKFESEFAIYDLPEFLRSVDLFDKSELNFNGGQNLTIKDTNVYSLGVCKSFPKGINSWSGFHKLFAIEKVPAEKVRASPLTCTRSPWSSHQSSPPRAEHWWA